MSITVVLGLVVGFMAGMMVERFIVDLRPDEKRYRWIIGGIDDRKCKED